MTEIQDNFFYHELSEGFWKFGSSAAAHWKTFTWTDKRSTWNLAAVQGTFGMTSQLQIPNTTWTGHCSHAGQWTMTKNFFHVLKCLNVLECQKYVIKFGEEQAPIKMNSVEFNYENKERILRFTLNFSSKQLKPCKNRVIH